MIKTAKEFISLRTSDDPQQYARAAKDSAPIEVWRDLIQNYPEMREWVATNKTCPIEILEILAADRDSKVRETVARKRSTPNQLLKMLAKDTHESVRLGVAWNAKASRDILLELTQDAWAIIAEQAKLRLRE